MNRRSFLLSLFVAPSVIAFDRLMPVKPWILPIIRGDGVHDDGPGIRAFFDGLEFVDEVGGFRTEIAADGSVIKQLGQGVFYTRKSLRFPGFPTRTVGAGALWDKTPYEIKTIIRPSAEFGWSIEE